ncbi:MAG: ABC transporter substrate-binding protein [Erysipelotrichaceae bacterium]|nr:ABC transporter substrate-binding protein [Erysipelotrichaceae bacterium]
MKLVNKLALILIVMLLAGCAGSAPQETADDENTIKIGILQMMTHGSLDEARQGFLDGLAEAGYVEGENLIVDYQNPEGDQSNMATMADHLIAEAPDLILAIATPPAQQLVAVNQDTPILGTAITDYTDAGLVDSNEHPGGLVSGTSDNCPMDAQLDLLLSVKPDIKTLGILYTSSEVNSEIQANQMEAECEKRGIEVKRVTIPDKTVINDAMASLAADADAVYIPTDNNIASAMGSVDVISRERGLITLVGVSDMVKNGGCLSLGVNYYDLGKQTAEMAVKVLNGEDIGTLPVGYDKSGTVYYNSDTLEAIGIQLTDDFKASAIDMRN